MKKKILHFMSATTILVSGISCSSINNDALEHSISNYVQTDKQGTKTDLQFKMVKMDVANRTVGDSLAILHKQFESEKNEAIESENKNLAYWQGLLSTNPKGREAERYNENITIISERLDSLSNLSSEAALRYNGLKDDEVLALVAKCRYSYIMPGADRRQERTDTFILTADGKEVIGKKKQTQ